MTIVDWRYFIGNFMAEISWWAAFSVVFIHDAFHHLLVTPPPLLSAQRVSSPRFKGQETVILRVIR